MLAKFCQKIRMSKLNATRVGGSVSSAFNGRYVQIDLLARLELAEALKILAGRLPNPRRVGPAQWKPLLGMSGPTSLHVEFDTASF